MFSSRLRRAPLSVLLSALSAHAFAQTSTTNTSTNNGAELDPVVVTASRGEQRLSDTLPHTTVLTRTEIERQQARNVVDLLARQAGVEFARTGVPGAQASLFVRGTNSNQVLVLIDGVRVNNALGAAKLDGLTVDTIERIEIARGNLSSVYGSEAVGGVVQIFTRGGKTGTSAGIELGSGRYRSANAAWSGNFDGTSIALSAATQEAQPFSSIDTSQVVTGPFVAGASPDDDKSRQRSGSLRFSQALGQNAEVGLSAWGAQNRVDFDSPYDGPNAFHVDRTLQEVLNAYGQLRLAEVWQSRLSAARAQDRSRVYTRVPGQSQEREEFRARNDQYTWSNSVQVAEKVTANVGAERLEQRGASTNFDPNFSSQVVEFDRYVNSAWFGLVGAANKQSMQANVRLDHYSDFGDTTNGFVAYGYALTPSLRVNLQHGTAFRAPSFNDLYYPVYGNPNLRPERSYTSELGLRYVVGPATLRTAVFRTRTRDLIGSNPVNFQSINIARAKIEGLELAASGQIDGWRLDANWTLLRARDATSNQRLLRRAPYTVNASVSREFGRALLGTEVSHAGKRFDGDINSFSRMQLHSYTLVRLFGSYKLTESLRLTARVENALDESYELVDGYNTQGVSGYLGLQAKF